MAKTSAGIVLYRQSKGRLEVMLGHMGGPFWRKKDTASWTIPKGEFDPDEEDPLEAALREFEEETGIRPKGNFLPLTPIKQSGGKKVFAWALAGDLDPASFQSNRFEIEWPPRSGRVQSFPELDRVQWFEMDVADRKILKGQRDLLAELATILAYTS